MSAAELGASMDSDSFIHRTEGDPEATLSPFSVSSNWMDDGNETNWNQFQQPGWQVRHSEWMKTWMDEMYPTEFVVVCFF